MVVQTGIKLLFQIDEIGLKGRNVKKKGPKNLGLVKLVKHGHQG